MTTTSKGRRLDAAINESRKALRERMLNERVLHDANLARLRRLGADERARHRAAADAELRAHNERVAAAHAAIMDAPDGEDLTR